MIRRILAGTLGALNTLNGLAMLVAPERWFTSVPGVLDTGPFNPHLVFDVGLAFVAAGGALLAMAWRPHLWPAALAGSAFLGLHAGLHVVGMLRGHSQVVVFDLAVVVVPALVAVVIAWPPRKPR